MMTDNVVDLVARRKRKALTENVKELREINHITGEAILGLTTYDKYSTVRRVLEDLFVLHQDIKRAISTKEEILERLKHE